MHDEISSLRVEPGNRSATCDDLREGEIAFYHHPNFQGDCVVLAGRGSYPNADAMGIRNDSISSLRNNSRRKLRGFANTEFEMLMVRIEPHASDPHLVGKHGHLHGPDDSLSSIQMVN